MGWDKGRWGEVWDELLNMNYLFIELFIQVRIHSNITGNNPIKLTYNSIDRVINRADKQCLYKSEYTVT